MNLVEIVYKIIYKIGRKTIHKSTGTLWRKAGACLAGLLIFFSTSSCSGLDFPEVSDVLFYSLVNGGVGTNPVGYYNGVDTVHMGRANGLEGEAATSVWARDGKIIYAYTPLVGLTVSKDAGQSFTTKPGAEGLSAELFYSKGRLYIFGSSGVWVTEDDGDSFSLVDAPAVGNTISAVSGNRILIGTGSSLYVSTNSGNSFELLQNTPFASITVLQAADRKYLVGASNGIHVSYDGGSSWNSVMSTQLSGAVTAADFISGDIYVITGDASTSDLYISGDKGITYGRHSNWQGFGSTLPYRKLTKSAQQVGVLHNNGVCTAERNSSGKPQLPFICVVDTGLINPSDLHMVDGRLDLGR